MIIMKIIVIIIIIIIIIIFIIIINIIIIKKIVIRVKIFDKKQMKLLFSTSFLFCSLIYQFIHESSYLKELTNKIV